MDSLEKKMESSRRRKKMEFSFGLGDPSTTSPKYGFTKCKMIP
jgi:hypothetical protein